MTPNPNSPIFIKHEVPEYACNNSKLLSIVYSKLVEDIRHEKWQGISISDIALTYNTYDGCTEVKIVYKDNNNHTHHFIMQLVPDNGFGDINEDNFRLIYLFEGKFDENAISIRSFAEYLSIHLQYEGFEPELINSDNGLSLPCLVQYSYDEICRLIDITLSNIKPLVWFYTKEPVIKTFDEVYYYMAGVQARVQLESCKGRWCNVRPICFKLVKDESAKEVSLELRYVVENIWELSISINAVQCDSTAILELIYPMEL